MVVDTHTLILQKARLIDQLLDELDELSNAIRYEALSLRRLTKGMGWTIYDFEG